MKYYSDKLNKMFETQEECEKAEQELVDRKKALEEKQAALKAEREKRSKEVVEAFKAARAAEEEANKLLNAFVKDYGSFHMSLNGTTKMPSIFDALNNFFIL